jgi:GGDEF domain-containing protein
MQIEIPQEIYAYIVNQLGEPDPGAYIADVLIRQWRENALPGYDADPLTGCANRRRLELDLFEVAASEHALDAIFVCLDILHLKGYNAAHGEPWVDAQLGHFGEALRASFPSGKCYRFGDDEFVVWLPAGAEVPRCLDLPFPVRLSSFALDTGPQLFPFSVQQIVLSQLNDGFDAAIPLD